MNNPSNLLFISNIILALALSYISIYKTKPAINPIEKFQCPEVTSQKLKSTVIDLNTKTVVCEYHKK